MGEWLVKLTDFAKVDKFFDYRKDSTVATLYGD